MARTRSFQRRKPFEIFRKNNVNEFNLISCYQKQEIRLNSFYTKYFKFFMITKNQISSSKNTYDYEYFSNLLYSFIIRKNNIKFYKYLIERGLNIAISNKNKLVLYLTCKNKNNLNIFKYLINNNNNNKNENNDNHTIDIFMNIIKNMIKRNNLKQLKIFIKYHILNKNNINWADRNGDTPLIYAIKYGYKEVLQVLIDNGADLQYNNKKIIECLKKHYDYDILKLLVANNFNINQTVGKGILLLNYFIKDRNDKSNQIAKGLIDCGANVNYQYEINKEEPLVCAIRTRNIKMIKYLIENGANFYYFAYYNYINMYYNYNTFCKEFYYEIYDIINNYIY